MNHLPPSLALSLCVVAPSRETSMPRVAADGFLRSLNSLRSLNTQSGLQKWHKHLQTSAAFRGATSGTRGRDRPAENSSDGNQKKRIDGEGEHAVPLCIPDSIRRSKHFRLTGNTFKGRLLPQICYLDNKKTDTQATVWADRQERMVRGVKCT